MKTIAAVFAWLLSFSFASAAMPWHVEADSISPNQNRDEGEIFSNPEQMPEFPGGMDALMKFLRENTKYPEECMRDSVQGRVLVSFVVDTLGDIVEPKVIKSVHPLLDAEALRVVKISPRWNPGVSGGKPQRVRYTIPIVFKLNPAAAPVSQEKQSAKKLIENPMDQFPGGQTALMEYIRKHVKYPPACLKDKIEGRVWVSFFLNGDGTLTDIKLERSDHPLFDYEALRVIHEMPRWNPVPNPDEYGTKVTVPIVFKMNNNKKK